MSFSPSTGLALLPRPRKSLSQADVLIALGMLTTGQKINLNNNAELRLVASCVKKSRETRFQLFDLRGEGDGQSHLVFEARYRGKKPVEYLSYESGGWEERLMQWAGWA